MHFVRTLSGISSKMKWWLGVCAFFFALASQAQTDDLMIVEYLDSDPGSGFGITIFNPTNAPINLGTYKIGVYNNGNTTGNEYPLSGILPPGGFSKAGNNSYCGACGGGCDQTNNSGGVNGNDVVVLFKSPGMTIVDMIGLYGVDLTWQVEGTNNALFHHHLYRRGSNCTRYTSTDGVSSNSWPNTPTVNVQGWRVEAVTGSEACLKAEFAFDNSIRVTLPADTSFCQGSPITIQASSLPGFQYSWNTGQTSSSISVSTSGTYIVEGTKTGCKTRDTIEVDIKPNPALQLNVADSSLCDGDSFILRPKTNQSGWQYAWSTGATASSITVSQPGLYILDITQNGCHAKDTSTVTIKPLPVFSLGADTSFCIGDSIALKSNLSMQDQYTWSNGKTTESIFVRNPGWFALKIRNGKCFYTDSVLISENSLPQFTLGADRIICSGNTTLLSIQGSIPAGKYIWNTGDTTRSLTADSGKYSLFVTDVHACVGRDTIEVQNENPLSFSVTGKSRICNDSSTALVPQFSFARYLWNTGDTTRNLLVYSAGTYSVSGFSAIGCLSVSTDFQVETFPCDFSIPNLFTPNGDGDNDVWKTKELFLASVTVKVFNRWGQEVFSSSDPAFSWDGINSSAGNYFYHLTGVTVSGEDFQSTGWVSVAK